MRNPLASNQSIEMDIYRLRLSFGSWPNENNVRPNVTEPYTQLPDVVKLNF
jgi:hypothetical protein